MTAIHAIATQPAPYYYEEAVISEWMQDRIADPEARRKLAFLSRNSGISGRYSVLPDFSPDHGTPLLFSGNGAAMPGTAARMAIYNREAFRLGKAAAEQCLADSNISSEHITHLITVSCTGLAAPGPEIAILQALGLSSQTERYTVNFMGCYGALQALKMAGMIGQNQPESNILIVCVELCTLHFRNTTDHDNLLASTLFSDGAAAVLLTGDHSATDTISLNRFGSTLIPGTGCDMGWKPGDTGFEMQLSERVPGIIREYIGQANHALLQEEGLTFSDIHYLAIHPGGKNILKAFAEGMEVDAERLQESFATLQAFGNMSSPAVLFVLDAIRKAAKTHKQPRRNILMSAFGPGLSVESALMTFEPEPYGKIRSTIARTGNDGSGPSG